MKQYYPGANRRANKCDRMGEKCDEKGTVYPLLSCPGSQYSSSTREISFVLPQNF
jgi:hypothetical protein